MTIYIISIITVVITFIFSMLPSFSAYSNSGIFLIGTIVYPLINIFFIINKGKMLLYHKYFAISLSISIIISSITRIVVAIAIKYLNYPNDSIPTIRSLPLHIPELLSLIVFAYFAINLIINSLFINLKR